jgi:hypothetical protein
LHARRHLDAARGRASDSDGDGDAGRELALAASEDARAASAGLMFDSGAWCDPRAVELFAAGVLDDERVLRLLRGLAVLDYRVAAPPPRLTLDAAVAVPVFDHLALVWRGASLQPLGTDDRERLGPRPGWAAHLAAGAAEPVVAEALRRLRLAGMPPIARADDLLATAPAGVRLGAALLVPLGTGHVRALARRLTITSDNNQEEENA